MPPVNMHPTTSQEPGLSWSVPEMPWPLVHPPASLAPNAIRRPPTAATAARNARLSPKRASHIGGSQRPVNSPPVQAARKEPKMAHPRNTSAQLIRGGLSRKYGRVSVNRGAASLPSKPVVAGIVGRQKYQYDIWGDTVNMASRIQGEAPLGGLCVSSCAWRRIEAACTGRSLGLRELKGKGAQEVFLVESVVG
jgi:hypothetical protein